MHVAPHAEVKADARKYQYGIAYLVNDRNDATGGDGDATLAWRCDGKRRQTGHEKFGINLCKNTNLATDHSDKTHTRNVQVNR